MIIFNEFASIIQQPGITIDEDALEVLDKRLTDEGIPHAFTITKTDAEIDELHDKCRDVYKCDVAYDSADETKVAAVIFLWAAADLGFEGKRFRRMVRKYLE